MQFLRNLKKDLQLTRKGYYTRIVKRHFGPFKKRQSWLAETQYYSQEQLNKLQLDAFQYLVRHVYETVPYYRDYMKQKDFGPDDIVSLDDVQRFEIIDKHVVRSQADRFVSSKYVDRFMRTVHTGGTTGTPLPIRRNLRGIQTEHAFVRRQFDWAGIKMSDRVAYLTWRRMAAPNATARWYAYDAGLKELHLSTVHLSEDMIIPYAETMKKYNIKAINGYPSAVYFMAKGLLAKNHPIKLNAILTTSETMEPHQRQVIEKAFQCQVYDYYGCAERVCYIHTCEQGNYHILPEYGITELIPAEAPNEGCHRVVGTGFWNLAMPLIRYNMGDLVQKQEGDCSCGRAFPMVSRIMGRDGTYIQTPSG
ncbi:MAG: phenylacetate--CoA ligase family protein, partial [Planctomycetota bacterium]